MKFLEAGNDTVRRTSFEKATNQTISTPKTPKDHSPPSKSKSSHCDPSPINCQSFRTEDIIAELSMRQSSAEIFLRDHKYGREQFLSMAIQPTSEKIEDENS